MEKIAPNDEHAEIKSTTTTNENEEFNTKNCSHGKLGFMDNQAINSTTIRNSEHSIDITIATNENKVINTKKYYLRSNKNKIENKIKFVDILTSGPTITHNKFKPDINQTTGSITLNEDEFSKFTALNNEIINTSITYNNKYTIGKTQGDEYNYNVNKNSPDKSSNIQTTCPTTTNNMNYTNNTSKFDNKLDENRKTILAMKHNKKCYVSTAAKNNNKYSVKNDKLNKFNGNKILNPTTMQDFEQVIHTKTDDIKKLGQKEINFNKINGNETINMVKICDEKSTSDSRADDIKENSTIEKQDNNSINQTIFSSIAHNDKQLNDSVASNTATTQETNTQHCVLRRSDRLKNKKGKHQENQDVMVQVENNPNICASEEKNRKDEANTAVLKHAKEMGHEIDWINSKVIWSDNNPYKLLIKQSLSIKAYEPELNRTTHSVLLYIFPEGVSKCYLPKFTN